MRFNSLPVLLALVWSLVAAVTGRTQPTATLAANFTVTATAAAPLMYQWRRHGTRLAGRTGATVSLANVAAADAGTYEVLVAKGTAAVASHSVTLSVNAATAGLPVIVTQPAGATIILGGPFTLAVAATSATALTYQWRRDGAPIADATTATLTLAGTAAVAGDYSVVVTSTAGSVTSAPAVVHYGNRGGNGPVFTQPPAARSLVVGDRASRLASAPGASAFQWFKEGVALAGATAAALVWSAVPAADSGRSTVAGANSAGSVTSAAAVLTVLRSSYAGSWFGSLGTGGTFALQVNDDDATVLLGFAPGSRTAYVDRTGSVDGNGRFRFTVAATPGGPATAGAPVEGFVSPGAAPAVAEMTVEGAMGDDGALSGFLSGPTPVPLTAARANAAGATATVAGFYVASAEGSSAQTSGIVGPAGQACVLTQTGATFDGGAGSVDAIGRIAVTTAAPQTFTATVSAELARITAAMTDAKGTTTQFAGFGAHAPALGEQRLVNLSTRTTAGAGDEVAIVGFTLTGIESKPVLIRAVGPTHGSFGVATALTAPRLVLYNRDLAVVGRNTGWTTSGTTAPSSPPRRARGRFRSGRRAPIRCCSSRLRPAPTRRS